MSLLLCSDRLKHSSLVLIQIASIMNESYDSFCPEFTRPRANTCPTSTFRRPRPAEFSPDADACVASMRLPSPPELYGYELAKRLKGASDYEPCSPSASGLPDYGLDSDLEASLFCAEEPSGSGASCSYLSGPGSSGVQKKKRRNPWGPETYAELISKAIESLPDRRATLQQIYKFIIGYNKFFRDRSEGSLSAGWKVTRSSVANIGCASLTFESQHLGWKIFGLSFEYALISVVLLYFRLRVIDFLNW